jgi:transcriptional regulator with XRE-family HTH domain
MVLPRLSRLIKRRRQQRQLNLPGLAQLVGMGESELCHLEEGFGPWPGAARIRDIAHALGCDEPAEMLERPGMMPVNTPTADAVGDWLFRQRADQMR